MIHDGKDSFCELFWEGLEVEIIAGKIGTKGRAKRLELASNAAAERYIADEIARREKQGFVEVASEGTPAEQATLAPRAKAAPELLADVLAHPDEDPPRMVYADYLLSQGDPLGELINVQCERARLDRFDPKQRILADREEQLLVAFRRRWVGKLDEEARVVFTRGFIDRIRLESRGAAVTGVLDRALAIAPLIRTVELPGDVSPVAIGSARSLAHLTGLVIRGTSLEMSPVGAVMRTKGLHALDRLGMRAGGIGRTQLKELEMRRWRELDFHQNTLGVNGVRVLVQRFRGEALEVLDIGSSGVGVEGVRHLLDEGHYPKLWSLGLRRSGLSERAAAAIAATPNLPALRVLDLSYNGISGDGLVALFGSQLPITDLDLSATGLGDDTVALLAGSPLARRLVVLDLAGNGITERGATALAAGEWPALRQLVLSSNPIGKRMTAAIRERLPEVRVVMRAID